MANTKTTNRNVSFFIRLLSFALSSIQKFRFSDYLDSPYKGFHWGAQGKSGGRIVKLRWTLADCFNDKQSSPDYS